MIGAISSFLGYVKQAQDAVTTRHLMYAEHLFTWVHSSSAMIILDRMVLDAMAIAIDMDGFQIRQSVRAVFLHEITWL